MSTKACLQPLKEFLKDERCEVFADGTVCNARGRKFRGYLKKSGYYRVRYKNYSISVARLVCAKFHGMPTDAELQANHKDGNTKNNKAVNLEWVTFSENLLHRYRVLGTKGIRGNHKITEDIAAEIRLLANEGMIYKDLCEKFQLSKSTISYVVNKRTWRRS